MMAATSDETHLNHLLGDFYISTLTRGLGLWSCRCAKSHSWTLGAIVSR